MTSASLKCFLLIFISVCIIPFLFSSSTIDPVLLPRFIALSILTFVLILLISISMVQRQFCNAILKCDANFNCVYQAIFPVLISYLVIAALALTKAINVSEGLFEWLKLFLASVYFYTAVLIIGEHPQNIVYMTRALVITGLVLGIIGACQYFDLCFRFIPGNFEMYSTLVHKNLFASALVLIFPFTCYGVMRMAGFWRIISLTSAAVVIFCLGAARTRSAWLAMIVAAITTLVAYLVLRREANKKGKIQLRFKFKYFLHILIAGGLLSTALFTQHPFKFAAPLNSVESMVERFLLWEKTLRMVRDEPLLGVGPGQWKIVLPRYGKIERWLNDWPQSDPAEVIHQRPHNDYLWIMAETGCIGFILYVFFFILLFVYLGKILMHSSDDDRKIFIFGLLFAITGYMVIALFSFPKERMVHTTLLMLTAASIVAIRQQALPLQKVPSPLLLFAVHFVLLLLLAFCIVVGFKRYSSEVHTQKALAAREAAEWEQVIFEINQADLRFYNMDPVSMPLVWYRGVANFSLNRLEAAFNDFQKAQVIHPHNIHVLNNLGVCYALKGEYAQASAFYQKALVIFPRFKEAQTNIQALRPYYRITND